MRILCGICLAAVALSPGQTGKTRKDGKHAEGGPTQGIKTPGVQIPFAICSKLSFRTHHATP